MLTSASVANAVAKRLVWKSMIKIGEESSCTRVWKKELGCWTKERQERLRRDSLSLYFFQSMAAWSQLFIAPIMGLKIMLVSMPLTNWADYTAWVQLQIHTNTCPYSISLLSKVKFWTKTISNPIKCLDYTKLNYHTLSWLVYTPFVSHFYIYFTYGVLRYVPPWHRITLGRHACER